MIYPVRSKYDSLSTLLEDLQTYNEVCTLLGDLQKTVKSTLLKDLEIYFTC